MNKPNDGVIFTRQWVVELMLDCCGYVPENDLVSKRIVEPSCGRGAFLFPLVNRLLQSLKKHDQSPELLKNSLLAFEVDPTNLDYCRLKLHDQLLEFGIDEALCKEILDSWLFEEDYLTNGQLGTVDFVIGNPPYIRGTELEAENRTTYVKACKTMTPGTDIYVGFIETALRSLSADGVVSFICADRWMHNAYGKKLRKLVASHYAVELVLEMHDVDVFTSKVSAYPAIVQIRNSKQSQAVFAELNESFSCGSTAELLAWLRDFGSTKLTTDDCCAYKLSHWFNYESAWPLTSPDRLAFLDELNTNFIPLQDDSTGTRVGIGVATGKDEVFLLEDPNLVEEELLVPLVTTGQAQRGGISRKDVWLLNPWAGDGSLIDLARYPKAQKYLAAKEPLLRSRHVARKAAAEQWYRTIDKVYPKLAATPKLLIQDMKSAIQPVYDAGNYYPHHNLYWITSDKWDLEVLGGLLLSKLIEIIIDAYGVKMRGGTYRLQAQYLRKIRLPNPDALHDEIAAKLKIAFRTNDRELADEASLAAFGLERIPA
ncbi:MAG: Eco57I restriction-modification methylase domain-containing protein [Coriobacteriia bacterium]|nr:Eco57I restriction-modification methylase domain-containing protein [Coriobacteriia bacterium]